MNFDTKSNSNPFALMAQNKIPMRNNPFQFGKSDLQELTLNITLKIKPRLSQYPKLEINPFIKEEKEDNVPFKKGEQDYKSIFKPPHRHNSRPIYENHIDIEVKEEKDMPNNNIFICDSKSLTSNNPFLINPAPRFKMQKRLHTQEEIRNVNNNRRDKNDGIFDLIVNINNNSNNPTPSALTDTVDDCINLLEKLNINNQQCYKNKMNDLQKMFTNDGSNNLGEFYFH